MSQINPLREAEKFRSRFVEISAYANNLLSLQAGIDPDFMFSTVDEMEARIRSANQIRTALTANDPGLTRLASLFDLILDAPPANLGAAWVTANQAVRAFVTDYRDNVVALVGASKTWDDTDGQHVPTPFALPPSMVTNLNNLVAALGPFV